MSRYSGSLLKDSAHTFGARILTMVVAAGLGIITARLLGPSQRGIYVVPMLYAGLAGAFLAGLSATTSYYMLSERRGAGILKPAAITGAVFIAGGAVAVAILSVTGRHAALMVPAMIALIPAAVISLAGGYCYGIYRVRYANYLSLLGTVVGLAVTPAGLLLFGRNASIAIVMWLSASWFTALVAAVFVWFDSHRRESAPVRVRDYFTYAVKIGSTNLLTILNFRVDMYVIAALASPAILGIYSLAVAGAEAVKIVTLVLSQSAAPRIGSLDTVESAHFTARCVRINFVIALVPCVLVFVAAPWLMGLLYGPAFAQGGTALRILTIGVFALAPGSLLSAFYTLRLGRPMVSFWNAAMSAAICLGLSVVLIPRYGMNGAAIASTAGYVAGALAIVLLFIWENAISPAAVMVLRREDLRPLGRVAAALARRLRPAA